MSQPLREENGLIEIDLRGLSCPIPMVRTKKSMDEHPGQPLLVLVDSDVSKENVSRLAESRSYSVKVENVKDGFRLLLTPTQGK